MIGRSNDSRDSPESDRNLIKLVEQLRSIISRQQLTIAEQRAEIETLRASTRTVPPTERGPEGAGAPLETPPVARAVSGADFTIVFDGGAIGNPGSGYGSYQIVGPDGLVAHERLNFGERVTNNQAEYRTLIEALQDLRNRVGRAASEASVAVRGDSQLVVEQVNGRWKVKHAELRPLHQQVVELLRGFGRSDVAWHRRDASVRVLGH